MKKPELSEPERLAMAIDELTDAAAERRAAVLSPNQAELVLRELRRAEAEQPSLYINRWRWSL